MNKNIGSTDRIIRSVIAIVALLAVITDFVSGVTEIVLISFSTVVLVSALIGFCPTYRIFGYYTCTYKDEMNKMA